MDKVWTKLYCHFYFRGITLIVLFSGETFRPKTETFIHERGWSPWDVSRLNLAIPLEIDHRSHRAFKQTKGVHEKLKESSPQLDCARRGVRFSIPVNVNFNGSCRGKYLFSRVCFSIPLQFESLKKANNVKVDYHSEREGEVKIHKS